MTYIKIYENVYLSIFDDGLILNRKIRYKQIKKKEKRKKKKKKRGGKTPRDLFTENERKAS